MSKKLVGFFDSDDSAQEAIDNLRGNGFDSNEISLVSKQDESVESSLDNQNLTDGTLTGGAIGGLAGLGLGASTLIAGPLGIGAFLAAGPISSLLAGAVGGGIFGGLIDYGIPEENSREYESRIEGGEHMLVIEVDDEQAGEVAEFLRNDGAQGVESH
ncbi:MAG TPA: general stress protein [Syntrophomonadaceae bacterium]|nr:general stress protein [Syntrophomonadaceae bacterium]